jgi:hypothetical protein
MFESTGYFVLRLFMIFLRVLPVEFWVGTLNWTINLSYMVSVLTKTDPKISTPLTSKSAIGSRDERVHSKTCYHKEFF